MDTYGEAWDVERSTFAPTREHDVIDLVMYLHVTSGIGNLVSDMSDGGASFELAKDGLRRRAKILGANAVVGVNFDVRHTSGGWTLMAVGTAIRYRAPAPPPSPPAPRYKPLNLGSLLAKAALPQYIKPLLDAGLTADRVPHLTDLELRTLGISDVTHRTRILQAVAASREEA